MSERLDQLGGLPMFDTTPMETGPDEKWIADAVVIIRALALTRPELTSADVWERMSVTPNEPRAMGAAFRLAKEQGLIRSTGHYVPFGSHGRPIRVWRSMVRREI